MSLTTNLFDIWVFHAKHAEPEYLLMQTSQAKADKWFKGGRFWQILGGHIRDEDSMADAVARPLRERGLQPEGIWSAEHTYIIYNLRRKALEAYPVFAARVDGPSDIPLSWEHSESGWYTAQECYERIHFRGLTEGLDWTRRFISEVEEPAQEMRLL